jgi:RsiW-degrading membrane proteinase PrsW (M82 family)
MGATWECLAFIFRTVGAHDQQQLSWVIAATLLLLLAPLWINAFVYMTVARLVNYILPSQSIWGIKATWLTRFFVGLDIVSFLVQAAGGSLMSNQDPDSQNVVRTGQQVYMSGIGIQLGFILVFGALTVAFYMAMAKEARFDRDIRRTKMLVWVLLAVMVLIMVSRTSPMAEF